MTKKNRLFGIVTVAASFLIATAAMAWTYNPPTAPSGITALAMTSTNFYAGTQTGNDEFQAADDAYAEDAYLRVTSGGIMNVNGGCDEGCYKFVGGVKTFDSTLAVEAGRGGTLQGMAQGYWANAFYNSNPLDTDNGNHPQNVYRAQGRVAVQDDAQFSTYFKSRLPITWRTLV